MSKGHRAEDPAERARRKLAKAQLKLHVAEDELAQVRARGKQEVEAARLRAAQWQAKAVERVEKRTAALLHAESRLQKALDTSDTLPEAKGDGRGTATEQREDSGEGAIQPDTHATDPTGKDEPLL